MFTKNKQYDELFEQNQALLKENESLKAKIAQMQLNVAPPRSSVRVKTIKRS